MNRKPVTSQVEGLAATVAILGQTNHRTKADASVLFTVRNAVQPEQIRRRRRQAIADLLATKEYRKSRKAEILKRDDGRFA